MLETTRLQLPSADERRLAEYSGRVLTIAGVVLYISIRLWRLSRFNLQRDEIFSLEAVRLGWRAMFAAITADVVHPPLFYVLLKIWILIGGQSLQWLRLLPTIISFLALLPFLTLCRELRIPGYTRSITLFLFAVNAYLVGYAHEVRMYSLLLCFSLCALGLFVRWWNDPTPPRRLLILLFIAHLLLVYTHYYAWLVVGVELSFVLLWQRSRIRIFAAVVSLLVVCYVPWLVAVMTALRERSVGLSTQLNWHYQPGVRDIAAFYSLLNGPFTFPHSTTIGLLMFGGIVIWTVADGWLGARASDPCRRLVFPFLVALAALPVVVAFAVSRFSPQSVWHTRYLIISAVPYLLLTAYALSQIHPRILKLLLTTAVIVWAGLSSAEELPRIDRQISWDVFAQDLREYEVVPGRAIKI